MRSMRCRLLFFLVGGVVLSFGAGAFVVRRHLRATLTDSLEEGIDAKARALGVLLEEDEDGVSINVVPGSMPEFATGEDAEYCQVWLDTGRIIARSESLEGADIERRDVPLGERIAWDLTLPDGRRGHAVALRVNVHKDDDLQRLARIEGSLAPDHQAIIVVATGREELDATISAVDRALGVAALVTALLLALTAGLSVRTALRPLRRLGRHVDEMDAQRLSRRLCPDGFAVELRAPIVKLNELLDRLHAAFERERRMTANLAHELRTPIAELRSSSEVALRWREDRALTAEALENAHAISVRMSELVEALLTFARIESGEVTPAAETIDLGALTGELIEEYRPIAGKRGHAIELRSEIDSLVTTDPRLVRLALSNMLRNAIEHAPRHSAIQCEVSRDGLGALRCSVSNPAPDLSHEDVERIAEPFWQKSPDRGESVHAGLGSAMCATIAQRLGTGFSITLDHAILCAALEFPAALVTVTPHRTSATIP